MANNNVPQHVLKSLRLSKPDAYNIYLVGSRLWGTHTNDSDWDLLIVGNVPSALPSSLHKCQYDIKLMDHEEFATKVKEGSIIEVVCALLRKEDMLQYSFDIGCSSANVNLNAVRTWLDARQANDLAKAEKFWLKGNRASGWKILRHMLVGRALHHYLVTNQQELKGSLAIDDIQSGVRPATLRCDKVWMQWDWKDVLAAVNEVLDTV